ncbi:MAG TPA: glycosyltransferase family 4 protein [Candidatus Sulfotelmatobacter sp.]|nr:glycosyltransferase family 4 protein [Candidatus Sulfotelmatobacter sp.]
MNQVRILVDSLADQDLLNAQMGNAREIMSRLDERFQVTTFTSGSPDPRLVRPNVRLVSLPKKRQTLPILREFIWGRHDMIFYVKSSPAARIYLQMRPKRFARKIVIGLVESQSDLRNEPTIAPEAVALWERTILRSDILFSNSAAVQASLQKEYGLGSEVISTGVDTKFFTPRWDRPLNARLRILFVGSLRPFKGPQLLVRAASLFPAVQFVIVGDGVMARELHAEVSDRRLDNVIFRGILRPEELREEYRQADIFLFPSKWEGSPKVILEASACGLPVIARNDYRPETVVDGETGLLGASDDELLERLTTLLKNSELRMRMGRRARSYSEQFDWNLITSRWQEIFVRLAADRNKVSRS